MYVRSCWAWHRELALSLSISSSLSCELRSHTSQLSHNDPDLVDTDTQPQFQYTDSSRSYDYPLTKPLAAASLYLEPLVNCSSVDL